MSENNTNQQPNNAYTQHGAPVHVTHQVIITNPKSTVVAYVLWFFLGQLGIHKFYLGKNFMGIIYLIFGLIGWATTFILIGWFFLAVVWLLMFFDLFTMPGTVRRLNGQGTSVRTF